MTAASDTLYLITDAVVMDDLNVGDEVASSRGLYMSDGIKTIDYVLTSPQQDQDEGNTSRRRVFEDNLLAEGLILERDQVDGVPHRFVKVHAPYEVCARYAEILHLRLPMKKEVRFDVSASSCTDKNIFRPIQTNCNVTEQDSRACTAVFSNSKKYLFDDGEQLFTPVIRTQVVDFILGEIFEEASPYEFGIEKLLRDGVYEAAYPVHQVSRLSTLHTHWASLRNTGKMQPLDSIKEYFGAKVALYFAWLGFYTSMLIPASVVGVMCFIYALATVRYHQPSNDICDAGQNVTMCPLCDYHCDFWKLEAACHPAKLSYLVDNPATVFFAVFMSLWAKIFLKLWKRYSAEISHRWDLTDYNMREEPPRAEYLAKLKDVGTRPNPVTGYPEPQPPFCRMRFPRIVLSVSTVLLLVIMAVAAMFGVIVYRMSVSAAPIFRHRTANSPDPTVFSSVTASLINLFCITIFNMVYTRVAVRLTEWELHRTQTEHEDSLTLKMYLLQFVNYYSSIFYIAFFKATWPGYPGDYNRIFGFRKEECEPGGCLIELSVQLATIMIGRQAINAGMEMGVPLLRSWCNKMTLHSPKQPFNALWPQWVKDFYRIKCDSRSLFFEYLEMVLQFGFVTIFVASFPLAPVFALVNNLLETRLDASKFIRYYRRPAPHRGKGIGVWLNILDTVSNIAVVTNSFIIAFTSNFIPETVYRYTVSSDGSLRGYLHNSLAYFSVMDFPAPYRPQNAESHLYCRYPAYRRAGGQEDAYQHTHLYWIILTTRLIFALVFQNVVFSLTIMVEWAISDIPSSLKEQIQKESHVTNKLIMQKVCLKGVRAGYSLADGSDPPYGPNERDTCHLADSSHLPHGPSERDTCHLVDGSHSAHEHSSETTNILGSSCNNDGIHVTTPV